jgi:serine/threonine protein kinase/TolB-like protein/Tfp pilus assembly protein PilF
MAVQANQALSGAMTPERWQKIRELFHGALERNAEERAAYLNAACAMDPSLRPEVEQLISLDEQADGFLEPTQPTLPSPNSQPVLQPGQRVGHYRIIDAIGRGGMGVVYKAEDSKLGRQVALKFLPATVADDAQALERFRREARAASALNHPNVCTIHAIEEDEGRPFIVMELLNGQTLAAYIAGRPLPTARLRELSVQIADALQAAHQQGIIHRDIKPGNIFVTDRGQAKILDFGLARINAAPETTTDGFHFATSSALDGGSSSLTKPGRVMGTMPYVSPEQLRGEQPDSRSDLFSFGKVLYEMATGRSAFSGTPEAAVDAILHREPPSPLLSNPGLPAELDRIVTKALEKNRELRYQSAAEMKADLMRIGEAAKLPGEVITARGKWHKVRPWVTASTMAVLLTVAVVAVLWKTAKRPEPAKAEALPQVTSIAVLPLENLSHDPEQEYLADGITAELITNLSNVGSVRVIARSSVLKYKSMPRSIPEIAKELKVDAVLEGTVLPSGNRVRVTTELIHAASEKNLWAESYDAGLDDVLALRNRITLAIIAGIRVKLTPPEEQHLSKARPVNSDAYLAYLHGMFYWGKGWGKEDVDKAIGMLERATALDPKFALAHARLAEFYMYTYGRFDPREEVAKKAFVAAQISLSLDSNLAQAYVARGYVSGVLRFPAEAAMQDFQRALALNPNLPEAHFAVGGSYMNMGLLDEALSEMKSALALDPQNFRARYYLARVHRWQQNYKEALLDYERSPDFEPALLWGKVLILFHLGQRASAYELISELRQKLPDNEDVASTYAILLAADGKKEQAEEQIGLAIRHGEGRGHFHQAEYNIASAYALMGNRSKALQWLRKTAEDRITCYPLFAGDPNLNNLRSDPEFQTWLGEMKSLWERRRASL